MDSNDTKILIIAVISIAIALPVLLVAQRWLVSHGWLAETSESFIGGGGDEEEQSPSAEFNESGEYTSTPEKLAAIAKLSPAPPNRIDAAGHVIETAPLEETKLNPSLPLPHTPQLYESLTKGQKRQVHEEIAKRQPFMYDDVHNGYLTQFMPIIPDTKSYAYRHMLKFFSNSELPDAESYAFVREGGRETIDDREKSGDRMKNGKGQLLADDGVVRGKGYPYITKMYGRYYYRDYRYPEKPIDVDFIVYPRRFLDDRTIDNPNQHVIRRMGWPRNFNTRPSV